jgi:hypothetical protein
MVANLTVELLSKAFERLPDRLLMPWLPKLLMMLRPHAGTALPTLVKEAAALFPGSLDALSDWLPPWYPEAPSVDGAVRSVVPADSAPNVRLDPGQQATAKLLRIHRATTSALAEALGVAAVWNEDESSAPVIAPNLGGNSVGELGSVRELIQTFGSTLEAASNLVHRH